MRQDCKNFESRTYASGETVRKCDLDLAPEAPWRCPDDCQAFERRLADVNWAHGTLVTPPTPEGAAGPRRATTSGRRAARRGRGHRQLRRARRSWPTSSEQRRRSSASGGASSVAAAAPDAPDRPPGPWSPRAGFLLAASVKSSGRSVVPPAPSPPTPPPDCPGPSGCGPPRRRGRALRGAALAQPRRGGVALQPDRRARPRPLRPGTTRRPSDGVAAGPRPEQLPYVPQRAGLVVTVDGYAGPPGRRPAGSRSRAPSTRRRRGGQWSPIASDDVFALAQRGVRAAPRRASRCPRRRAVDHPVVVRPPGDARRARGFPRLVVRAGARSQLEVVERGRAATWPPSSPGRASSGRAGRPPRLPHRPGARAAGLAGRHPGGRGRGRRPRSRRRRLRWAATTPACAPTAASSVEAPSANLVSLYFGDGDQMLDFRTFQDHAAPDTTSNLLFKGAVGDGSHSVYTGLIRVRPDGPGTNAFQTNRNIKLSEHAWAESVPEPRDREQRRALHATRRRSVRSTTSSASTSRAGACRRRSPSGSSWPASSTR